MTLNTYPLTQWVFKEAEKKEWLKAKVPGTVHTDLLFHDLIPHPYEGTNEKYLQWIDKKDWEYQTVITITNDMLLDEKIELVFDGLDTFATVSVNGQTILEANNMYREWKRDIKPFVSEGENVINVYFHSPINQGLKLLKASPYSLPAPNDDSVLGGIGEQKVSMFIRKAPYHFGWDWGPRFVTSGIWKDVRLECWSSFKLTDVYIEQPSVTKEKAELIAHITIESTKDQVVNLTLSTDNLNINERVELVKGVNSIPLPLTLTKPQLWWTHDLGDQPLYTFEVYATNDEGMKSIHSVRTGLRDIQLVMKEDDYGQTFQFELNGTPLFIKGANHIPHDLFLPSIDDNKYTEEIDSALDAHMNMIRVWGGGIYEKDVFYNYCDEKGLLVWQDFMFACSMYPGTSEFLNNVEKELEENITHLRNHPSIAVWCGNNEIDSMWKEYGENTSWGWGWKSQYSDEHRKEVWQAYDTLFHKLIPEKLKVLHPDNNYWPSSPMAELTYDENQHASLKRHRGDIHFWNVWHSRAPIEDYTHFIGRFMSEYGFQSFPERSTYEKIAPDQSLSITSESVSHHQKNKSGNDLIFDYLSQYYKKPKDFDSYLYLSQLLQGYAFDTAIRNHRKAMPYCMGTLYWQLNDAWPGASWSSIDYYGNWKASHYAVKKAYQKSILYLEDKGSIIHIYGVTDSLENQSVTLEVYLGQFSSKASPTKSLTQEVDLPKQSSTLLYTVSKDDIDIKENDSYVHVKLVDKDEVTIDSILYSFDRFKDIVLPHPTFTYSHQVKEEGVLYTIQSDTIAKGVSLTSAIEGHFKDNFFDLVPNEPYEVLFISKQKESYNEADFNLTIRSMVDFIHS
ncbi:glycoside hydrolase family 2 TIM barrel-domain containing protein [Alkalibacterium iburiense]|uniref:Beta-mannosidase B n=1 Tax=Alkalibacterium iburiense TaxID=290589 RepID=A0ABN0XIL6_9LACT